MAGISHVSAPPWERDLFVAGESSGTVHVWSLDRAAEVATVDTVFEFGGRRLDLVTGDEPLIVAGAWARHGVWGYTLAGERVWQDRERSAVRRVTALDAGRVAVGYARGPAVVLDATGQQLRSLRGVTEVHPLTPDLSLLESNGSVRLADADLEPTGKRIALRSFAVLDAAAGGGHVAVAEAAGPLRILDFDGAERAAHTEPGRHTLDVGYERASGTWQALVLPYRDGGGCELVRLSDDAEVLERRLRCRARRDLAG